MPFWPKIHKPMDSRYCTVLLGSQHFSFQVILCPAHWSYLIFTPGFRPALRAPNASIAPSFLQQSVEQWLETCVRDVHDGVANLLNHVTSMRALAAIRDSVWDLLAEVSARVFFHRDI